MKRIHRKMLGVVCLIPSAALLVGGIWVCEGWKMVGIVTGVILCFVVAMVGLGVGVNLLFGDWDVQDGIRP